MRPSIIYLFLIFLFNFTGIYSQKKLETTSPKDSTNTSKKERTILETLKYDGASTWGGIKHAYSRPFHWKGKDWAKFGAVAAGTALLYFIDEPANDFFTDQADDIPGVVQEFGFRFGKPVINYGITSSVYAFGLLTKNEKIRKTGVLLISAATVGGLIQTVTKTGLGRARPGTNKGNGSFKLFSNEAAYHSFPSGHTILTFTTAHAIAKQFKNPYVKSGIYAVGLISPVSRLWAGAHWLSDVGLGIVMSVVIVDSIDKYLNKNERYVGYKNPNKLNVKWNLKLGIGQVGFVGTF